MKFYSDFNTYKTRGWIISFIGLIVYATLRLFRPKPLEYRNICKYFEIGSSRSAFSLGWFFVCGKRAGTSVKNHEVGHMIQNAQTGGIKILVLSIASVFRYWKHTIFGSKTSYDSWWFEGQATELGRKYYLEKLKEKLNKELKDL